MRKRTKAEDEAAVEEARAALKLFKAELRKKRPARDPECFNRFSARLRVQRLPDAVIPKRERDLICRLLSTPPPSGKRTYAGGRDALIRQVLRLVGKRGFPPTRGNAMREKEARGEPANQSCCSIVQKALARLGVHMDERRVEDALRLFPKRNRPGK